MRENIGIFRGKDTIEHKWRYGNLTVHGDTAQIWEDTEQGLLNYLVDPETVGEFTGMNDEDGTRIFEGDIVKYQETSSIARYGIITFGEYATLPGFVSRNIGSFICWQNCPFIRQDLGFWTSERVIKVIGNIHDNPELLGGDGNAAD